MAEFEFAGTTFRGGKMAVILTALSTLGGGAWGAFEFYADYMDMKEIIQNIDTSAIEARNNEIEIKLDAVQNSVGEATDYSRSIKNDLRDDFNRMEGNVDRIEDQNREMQDDVRNMIDKASERFDNKRESLQTDTELKINALEDRLNKKIQNVLDNPLADQEKIMRVHVTFTNGSSLFGHMKISSNHALGDVLNDGSKFIEFQRPSGTPVQLNKNAIAYIVESPDEDL